MKLNMNTDFQHWKRWCQGMQNLTLGAQSWPALARPKPGGQFGNESEVELATFGKKIQGELISLARKKR